MSDPHYMPDDQYDAMSYEAKRDIVIDELVWALQCRITMPDAPEVIRTIERAKRIRTDGY